jgi:hypothetical protein
MIWQAVAATIRRGPRAPHQGVGMGPRGAKCVIGNFERDNSFSVALSKRCLGILAGSKAVTLVVLVALNGFSIVVNGDSAATP